MQFSTLPLLQAGEHPATANPMRDARADKTPGGTTFEMAFALGQEDAPNGGLPSELEGKDLAKTETVDVKASEEPEVEDSEPVEVKPVQADERIGKKREDLAVLKQTPLVEKNTVAPDEQGSLAENARPVADHLNVIQTINSQKFDAQTAGKSITPPLPEGKTQSPDEFINSDGQTDIPTMNHPKQIVPDTVATQRDLGAEELRATPLPVKSAEVSIEKTAASINQTVDARLTLVSGMEVSAGIQVTAPTESGLNAAKPGVMTALNGGMELPQKPADGMITPNLKTTQEPAQAINAFVEQRMVHAENAPLTAESLAAERLNGRHEWTAARTIGPPTAIPVALPPGALPVTNPTPAPISDLGSAEGVMFGDEMPEWALSGSITGPGKLSAISFDPAIVRPETVRNAASYAVEVFTREPGKPVEIALNPEELGRVRMALSTSDSGVTVLITSERPETLELMRRHIEQLSLEFQRLGYAQTSFEFSSEGSGKDDDAPDEKRAASYAASDADETMNIQPIRLVQTGLDLRL